MATLLGLFTPTAAQASGGFTNPNPNSEAIPWASLPDCGLSGISYGSSGSGVMAASQLGWAGSPKVALSHGGETVEAVPSLPCTQSGNLVSTINQNALVGQPDFKVAYGVSVVYSCLFPAGVIQVDENTNPQTGGFPAGAGSPPQPMNTTSAANGMSASQCPQLVGVAMSLYSVPEAYSYPVVFTKLVTWFWKPLNWKTTTGGWVPATSVNGVLPPGVELPIVCAIDTSGGDIFAITQHYWASIVGWVPCMLIPVGWDRAARIEAAWNVGPVGKLTAAYRAAVPAGIACGAVGTIPFYGQTIALNTCPADFAPGWVKTVLGYVIVLGVAALIVRRVMWSVGSRA